MVHNTIGTYEAPSQLTAIEMLSGKPGQKLLWTGFIRDPNGAKPSAKGLARTLSLAIQLKPNKMPN